MVMGKNFYRAKNPTLGRTLSWFCIAWGLAAILSAPIAILAENDIHKFEALYFFFIGLASMAAGYFGLKSRPGAFFAMAVIFAPQIAVFVTPDFHYNLTGPVKLGLGFGWHGHLFIYINFLAIAVCLLSTVNVFRLTTTATSDNNL